MASCLSDQEFAVSFETLFPHLLRLTRQELNCSYPEAEDFVCEVRLVAYELRERFDPHRFAASERPGHWIALDWQARFALWVTQIHRRKCLAWRTAAHGSPTTVPLEEVDEVADTTPLGWRERYQHLIDALPERERGVVNCHLDGYAQHEIAEACGCHRNSVRNLLLSAQERLRAWDNEAVSIPDLLPPLTLQEFKSISRVVSYHKPPGKMQMWKRSLPPNRTFRFAPSGSRSSGGSLRQKGGAR